jgi:two-component system, NtrC family, sensor kinase
LAAPTPLRRELLLVFGVLFTGALLVAALGLVVLLPVLASPAESVLFVGTLLAGDLLVLFAFGGTFLRRSFVQPMERVAGDVRRIAAGDYRHRVGSSERLELDQLSQSVNAMADRLIADQAMLAENVASLDRTNQELIEMRDQVVQAARLASVGSLAAGIAHEVGNPLGAIMAFVDVAKGRLRKQGADTELLDSIRDEAMRIDRIVRGLLDYARPRETEAAAAPPAAVLDRVRELLENQGKLDHVADTWSVEGEIPHVVMEPHRLEQVLVNLILNALDALEGHPDPQIHVRLSVESGGVGRLPRRRAQDPPGVNYMHRRRISRDEGGRGIDPLFTARHVVVMEVADNGPGIPEVDLESVFDPFFTTKEPGKGTGLGLAICARLVEGMGGRIEADNRPEGGASFTVRLPGVTDTAGGS